MKPGTVLAERFEIERLAASGGMAAVYCARDRTTGTRVALKALLAPYPQDVVRFTREAVVLGGLKHPGIVTYVAHGTASTGEPYLAVEWLEGETLADRLARERLSISDAIAVVRRAAEAVAYLHARGIVHRDIKPHNIFLVGGKIERAKILDFGIARVRSTSPDLTRTGALMGTPGYMAPEQARGERELDARADVFALGAVAFKCLSGRAPFPGEDVLAVLMRIVLEEPPRVRELCSEVPQELDDLVARMLSKEPADRPENAAEVARVLGAIAEKRDSDAGRGEGRAGLTVVERRVTSLVIARVLRGIRANEATLEIAALDRRDGELRRIATQYGGTFELLADGSMLVLFATAGAATDLAVRAAQCALEMRAQLSGIPLVVVSGRCVFPARLPIGEVIERGVSLVRRRGEVIRLDELTAALIGSRFEVRADHFGPTLCGVRDTPESGRTLLGEPTPCVGRDRELAVLRDLYLECATEPVARAAVITADAGVGKSRLRHEFVRALHDLDHRPADVWIGRGDPMSAGSPFGMLRPAIRRAIGLLDGEPLETQRIKVVERVARFAKGDDLDRTAEFVGELLGVPFDDTASLQLRAARNDAMVMGDQMRRAWTRFVVGATSEGPIVLVLEDLHWGDLPSIKLVDAALRGAHDRPFLVLALARPELMELFPNLWLDRGATHMSLPVLTRKSAERLVRAALGEAIPSELVERLLERAAGNAFYLEELIRAVAEGKGDALPETVLAMVQARLDGLDPEARRLLRAASVFGQAFWRGGVRALLGTGDDAEAIDGWLAILTEQELVSPRAAARFPNEQELVFRHAFVREASYAMLTDDDRALGHRLAAAWLAGAGEEDPLTLAEHVERGGQQSEAAGHYRAAAIRALEGNDFAAAVERAERAIQCGAEGELLGMLRLLQAEANRWRGEHRAAKDAALASMRALPEATPAWYAAVGEAVLATGKLGAFDELARVVGRLQHAGWSDPPTGAKLAATARAAFYLFVAGRHDLADALLDAIEPMSRANGDAEPAWAAADPAAAARLHQARATKALYTSDTATCLKEWEASVACFQRAGDVRNACTQQTNVGHALLAIGAHERAEPALRVALAEAEAMGLHTVAALARANLAQALARRGALRDAAAALERAIAVFEAQRDPRMIGAGVSYLADVLLARGELDAAERTIRRALELLEATPSVHAYAGATLARILVARQRPSEALGYAEAANRHLEALGGIEEGEALVRLAHAEALWAAGRPGDARAAIAVAAERLRARAAQISEPAWHEPFLRRVPEHARTLELAEAWSLPKAESDATARG